MVVLYKDELSTVASTKTMVIPDSPSQESGLCKAVAFDNYDDNCKTLSGREQYMTL